MAQAVAAPGKHRSAKKRTILVRAGVSKLAKSRVALVAEDRTKPIPEQAPVVLRGWRVSREHPGDDTSWASPWMHDYRADEASKTSQIMPRLCHIRHGVSPLERLCEGNSPIANSTAIRF